MLHRDAVDLCNDMDGILYEPNPAENIPEEVMLSVYLLVQLNITLILSFVNAY